MFVFKLPHSQATFFAFITQTANNRKQYNYYHSNGTDNYADYSGLGQLKCSRYCSRTHSFRKSKIIMIAKLI